MASIVANAFRERVVSALSSNQAALLDPARGGGPEFREMNRALQLADRAVREWAAGAVSAQRPGDPNRFERLDQLAKPEAYGFDVRPAAEMEHKAAQTNEQRAVAQAVKRLADAVPELDTEATLEMNTPALEATAEAAADVLAAAAAVLGGDEFILAQADETLGDLVAVSGWQNQLGPRFE
jgi:hypothetical protein